jgi:hypothetical protein
MVNIAFWELIVIIFSSFIIGGLWGAWRLYEGIRMAAKGDGIDLPDILDVILKRDR